MLAKGAKSYLDPGMMAKFFHMMEVKEMEFSNSEVQHMNAEVLNKLFKGYYILHDIQVICRLDPGILVCPSSRGMGLRHG
jgi:hypothetical protein